MKTEGVPASLVPADGSSANPLTVAEPSGGSGARVVDSQVWDLSSLAGDADRLPWRPLRPGVQVVRLYGEASQGPSAVLLKYDPGASVPLHEHTGYEHIFVLSGAQTDGSTIFSTGTLAIQSPGSRHRISSPHGCLVLVVYEKPVRFLE